MSLAVKKYLWIGTAVITIVVAWFVAAALGELLLTSVGKSVDLSQAPPANINQDAGVAPGFASTEKPIRLDDLLAGNLFDMPPEDYDADGGDGEATDAGEVEPLDVSTGPTQETIPICPVPLKVIALIAGPPMHPEWGFATIEHEGKTQEYRVGYELGGHRLTQITWNRVYIAQAGSGAECFIDIRYPDLARAGAGTTQVAVAEPKPPEQGAPVPPPAAPAEPQNREDRFRAAVDASIETVSDTERNVQRSLINTILDNQDIAMRQARVMPHEENGEVVGFKVYGIRRDSLFGKLGLENGDLIQTINDIPMTGADKALQAYGRLRMADRITISVTRRGQQLSLNYSIR
jgi:general secretion pathway protein C